MPDICCGAAAEREMSRLERAKITRFMIRKMALKRLLDRANIAV